ncbi:hypothetical protein AIOL_000866 [Candidatus Rhodobacter oscarellae]|uniref:Uncharacterized protein n=1 Tax=Candidatus Rhodobacter oscarellae TaxID=1675527 RepID=A0A0J9ED25_9RHOB|nr:hypothetical protein [Candidatus Rhodobacter lobularis]KMW60702.1 hypothetical protein AIOL_000866 [Candidatus Rhodobacter lobularis]
MKTVATLALAALVATGALAGEACSDCHADVDDFAGLFHRI